MRCILWPSVILQSHLPHVENSKIMALNGSPPVTNDTAGWYVPTRFDQKRSFNFKVPVVKLHVGSKVRRCHFLTRLHDAFMDRPRQLEYPFAGSIRNATFQTEEIKSMQI